MTKQEVMSCFWLPKGYYNDCVSGANMYTIKKCGGCSLAEENNDRSIIAEIKKSAARCNPEGKHLKKNQEIGEEFAQFINSTLNEIYGGGTGVVFTKVQAITVCSFLDDPEIQIYDGYYYISQK